MGNASLFNCGKEGFFDPHGIVCRRSCGAEDIEAELKLLSCDPAGTVFDDTLGQVSNRLDRAAFKFAGSSNLAALRWLFMFGASLQATDSNGTTLLHVACRTGSLHIVQDLVRRGLGLNAADSAGWTPLHVASCMGRQDVSLYLLRMGARANARNLRGQTPDDLCSQPWTKEVVIMHNSSRAKLCEAGFPTRSAEASDPRHSSASLDFESGGSSSSTGRDFGVSLHFEPFFVPRDAMLHEPRSRQDLQRLGREIFNRSPGHGIAFLVATGAVRDYPVEINSFLIRVGADPAKFGSFLGEEFPIAQTLRLEFLNSLPLLGTGVVSALETAFQEIAVPEDWLQADRLARGIAHFWWKQHEDELQDAERVPQSARENIKVCPRGELAGVDLQRSLLGTESLHRLMFSTLMLNQWLRSGRQMSLSEWTQLNMGIECNGTDVPVHLQTSIYKVLTEIRPAIGSSSGGRNSARRSCNGGCGIYDPDCSMEAPLLATLEGWAQVRYSGRAQMTQGSDTAVWPNATPRYLAASGGVMSAGRSAPLPGPPVKPHEAVGAMGAPCALSSVGAGGADRNSGGVAEATTCLLSRGVAMSPLNMSRPLDGGVVGGGPGIATAEAAWLSLRGWILLLCAYTDGATPYGFVSLRHAILKEADPGAKRIVLASRSDVTWPPIANGDEDWLDLCLLLGDGRFQAMEAPELEIRFGKQADYEEWKHHVEEICNDGKAHTFEMRMPAFLPSCGPGNDDSTVSSVPPLPGEQCSVADEAECDCDSDGGEAAIVHRAQQIPVLT